MRNLRCNLIALKVRLGFASETSPPFPFNLMNFSVCKDADRGRAAKTQLHANYVYLGVYWRPASSHLIAHCCLQLRDKRNYLLTQHHTAKRYRTLEKIGRLEFLPTLSVIGLHLNILCVCFIHV